MCLITIIFLHYEVKMPGKKVENPVRPKGLEIHSTKRYKWEKGTPKHLIWSHTSSQ